MKLRSFLLAMMLCALCVTQASALEYDFDAPEDYLFGQPTSDDTIYEWENPNVDRSKNTALVAPGFGTPTTELMVSVSGSLAQQESISISQNIRQGYRRRMERGEFITNKPPYGYRNAGDGKLEIIPEEAEIIRWVFDLYLNGYSPTRIAEEMNRRGIRKKYGKAKWSKISIVHWLENEKYTGSTLCQKTFSSGFPFVKKENRGELDQFYVENSHPAIISKEIFERVQALRQHKKISPVEPTQYPLTRKMVCGNCGATLYRNISNTGNATWICSQHMRSAAACPTKASSNAIRGYSLRNSIIVSAANVSNPTAPPAIKWFTSI